MIRYIRYFVLSGWVGLDWLLHNILHNHGGQTVLDKTTLTTTMDYGCYSRPLRGRRDTIPERCVSDSSRVYDDTS